MAIALRTSFTLVCGALAAVACSGSVFTESEARTDAGTGATSGGGNGSGGVQGSGASSVGGKAGGNGGGVTSTGGVTGTGGRVGTGGVIGAGGLSAGGVIGAGGSMSVCPPALPANGAPCTPDGAQCPYGQCCPSFATCHQGQWQVAIASCPQPVCPDSPPKNGDGCPCMQDGKSCDFNRCDDGGGHGTSTCSGGVWTVKDVGCPRPDYCANQACPSTSICMAVVQGTSGNVSLSCVIRQCPDPTSPVCSCIGTACVASLGQCSPGPTGTSAICDAP